MALDDIVEKLSSDKDERNKWIGVYLGVLAVLLAICGVGGGNATKDATRANIEAANTWAFFQAKNMRRNAIRLAAHPTRTHRRGTSGTAGRRAQAVRRQDQGLASPGAALTTDPVRKEGLDELFTKAKALEVERDVALRKDPYFDWSQALLQIGIVLASVHLIIGNMSCWGSAAASAFSACC